MAQWSDVESSIGGLAQQAINQLNNYWVQQLGSTPEVSGPPAPNGASPTYDEDPNALPAILSGGQFASASSSAVAPFPNAIYGAFASAGINALWNEDKDFIIKMSDKTLGAGPGGACKALPSMTYCDENGVAWIFMRWNFHSLPGIPAKENINYDDWQVWGAYDSPPNNPSGNKNQLAKYGLDLGTVAKSSWRVQQQYGFWTNQTANATVSSVLENITNLSLDQVVSWNMAVCDTDGILNGKHFYQGGSVSVILSKPWMMLM